MIEPPAFKNYLDWHDNKDSSRLDVYSLRKWLLERLPYEIAIKGRSVADLRDIGEITLGSWSAYNEIRGLSRYFFKEEVDAMAFKLKFL